MKFEIVETEISFCGPRFWMCLVHMDGYPLRWRKGSKGASSSRKNGLNNAYRKGQICCKGTTFKLKNSCNFLQLLLVSDSEFVEFWKGLFKMSCMYGQKIGYVVPWLKISTCDAGQATPFYSLPCFALCPTIFGSGVERPLKNELMATHDKVRWEFGNPDPLRNMATPSQSVSAKKKRLFAHFELNIQRPRKKCSQSKKEVRVATGEKKKKGGRGRFS